jgi:phage shock protein A
MQRTDSLTISDIETMVNATLDGGLVRQLQSEIMQLKDERAVLKNEIRTLKRKIKELKY